MSLGLYLHFPWCVRKCPYCDFNSHALRDELPEDRYIDTLLADVAAQAPRVAGRQVTSLFLGGGTPSLFGPASLARLFAGLRRHLDIASDAEVTLEANPATVERGRFAEYRDAGINRVSLGAQSFNDETLKVLGRIHQTSDVLRAAEELHAAGLSNFNLDLMYALPHQDVSGALDDLRQAVQLAPAHVSHYQLTLEPGTLFAAQPPPLPDDDVAWQMQLESQALLAGHGYAQYEVSAYARAGRQCRHNLTYWRFGDYLGVGAGAHGKLRSGARVSRSTHLREPRRYFASAAGGPEWRLVPEQDLPFEFMMNALRLTEGFTEEEYLAATGRDFDPVRPRLEELASGGLVQGGADSGRWRTTARGMQFLNEVLQRFLPEPETPAGARA
ncbi:radical SAM family heme chaperone HemW [uncultured Azohydromonas sp.]|uniref:radical SAM family heme chaperone HemW n=1 Tax=uncultured Azohydromonas sp. TaxID=487342 RepID=UPI00262ABA43|nr:radical SAM family heme chaperone HemW [uncultured Azohydromonas sp.]